MKAMDSHSSLNSLPVKNADDRSGGCNRVRSAFSGYLDGAISGREMQSVASHLEQCGACTEEFETLRGMQRALASMGSCKAPADLGLRLRLAMSHEAARRQGRSRPDWENLVRPMVLQVSAGLAGTIVVVGSIVMMIGAVAAPEAVLANDEPLGALTTPHYLYSAPGMEPMLPAEDTADTPIVIRAQVNAEGQVYDYTILSGPSDPETQAAIADELMLQVYAPARVFGEPVRGQVLITFAGVSVRG
jgi:anti-sigma factor RsiW